MALARLVGLIGKTAIKQLAGVANHVIPLKGWAGIHFIRLHVIMTKHSLVGLELIIRQFLRYQVAGRVLGIITFDLRQYAAQSGG